MEPAAPQPSRGRDARPAAGRCFRTDIEDHPIMPFPDSIDLTERYPLPGGGTVSIEEIIASCEEMGASPEQAFGAAYAWVYLLIAATILPHLKPPTLEDTLRNIIAISERKTQ
jgi:hypothetical protein